MRCVFNGVTADEFDPVVKADDATDVVYVGEFRHIKGADLLIDAVARLRADGRPVTLTLAGDGEEIAALKAQVAAARARRAVRFIGHVKARYGFSKGTLLVVPSRGDSMPYVVIEAAAAGIPMVAANVGGIPRFSAPTPMRCSPPTSPPRWRTPSRPRWRIRPPRMARAQSACANGSSCIFRRRRWSRACWPATATRLPIVNHSLPT